jgi:Ca2+-binding RTX toxin-like protein
MITTISTTVFQIQSGDVVYSAAAVGNVGLAAQSDGATIEFTTSTLNAQFIGLGGGGQTGVNVWLDIDAPFDFFDRFVETSGSIVTFNNTTEAGISRTYTVGQGSILFSPLLPANDDRPFEHFEVRFFPGADVATIVPGDATITLGLRIAHDAQEDVQYDPDFGAVHIEFTSGGPLPDLPRQFTAEQKARFQSDADALKKIGLGVSVLGGSVADNPAASLANTAASELASAISPQIGTANSTLQTALSLTNGLISAPTNPISLVFALTGLFNQSTVSILEALANDPPDGNYLDVFAAPSWSFGNLDGVSAAGNALVQDAWTLFGESLNLLAAAERFQGADLAGNTTAQAMQEAAFDAALERFEQNRVTLADSLTSFLDEVQANGFEDLTFEADTSLADLQAYLAGLTDPATEDPLLAAWSDSMAEALPGLLAQPTLDGPSFLGQAVADALAAIAAAVPSGEIGSVFDSLGEAAVALAAPAVSPAPTEGDDTLIGTDGNDVIDGLGGNDLIEGRGGADLLFGGEGNDTLIGGTGPNGLFGGAGDDSLIGGIGWEDLFGGDGNDTIIADAGNDNIGGGAGNDLVFAGDGDDTVFGGAGNDTIWGGLGNDQIGGGDGDDQIFAGGGNDEVWGGDGNDLIEGGAGNDTLSGGNGNDTIDGGDGDDELWGGLGNDSLSGGEGSDTIGGFDGADFIDGGDGDDELWGGAGNDTILGGNGADQIGGASGADLIDGGAGNDTVFAGDGNDTVLGGDGDDLIFGGAGDDRLTGGAGNDTVWGGPGADVFVFGAGDGADVFEFFNIGAGDRIELSSDLLGGAADGAAVVSTFGSIVAGNAVLDFGDGTSITLRGVTTLDGLDTVFDIV